MDVILVKTIPSLGSAGTVVTVRPGYARNFLFPKKLAVLATAVRLKLAAAAKAVKEQAEAKQLRELEVAKHRLAGYVLSFQRKASRNGSLYASIRPTEVVKMLQERHFTLFPGSEIHFSETIDHVGRYPVTVELSREVHAELILDIASL